MSSTDKGTICKGVILHLRSAGQALGAENVIIELAKNTNRYGYESIVGIIDDVRTTNSDFIAKLDQNNVPCVKFQCNGRFDLKCSDLILKYIKDNGINILHSHGYKEDFYGIICNTTIPKIATNHLWKTNTMMLMLYRALDAMLLRRFDLVTGVSDDIILEMNKFGIKNTVKIQNGIDVKKFNTFSKSEKLLKEFGIGVDEIVFGMVSSLTSEKNHALAINAFANILSSNSKLLIVGDGPLLNSLQLLSKKLGLTEKLIFAGKKNNIPEILSIMDVFLMPSLMEGLPMALLEAMACGKAVIASRVGENSNVIKNKINGLLFDSSDIAALELSMKYLIESREIINKLGSQARLTVEINYSSNTMAMNYCYYYDKLLVSGSV